MEITDLDPAEWEEIPAVQTPPPSSKKKPKAVAAPQKTDAEDDFFSEGTPKPAVPVKAPTPVVNKNNPLIDKMRKIFGTDTQMVRVPIYASHVDNKDPVFTYGIRKVTPEDMKWVTQLYIQIRPDAEVVDLDLWNLATMAIAVCSIDEGPLLETDTATPMWKALGIEPETSAHVRNPYVPHISIRKACADILFPLLYAELTEVGSVLRKEYMNKFDTQWIGTVPKPEVTPENPTIPER